MKSPEKAVTSEQKPAQSNLPTFTKLWLLSVVGMSLSFALQGFYPSLIGPASNVLPSACVGLAFWSSLQCARRYGTGLRKRFQATWVMFSLGTGLWLLAEMTWAFYYFVLSVSVPYPSAADVFYLGGYIPMLLGLTLYLGAFFQGMTRQRLVSALSLIVISGLVVVLLVIPPELSISEALAQRITDVSYPVLDLSLLSVTILSLAIFFRASLSRWLLIFAGVCDRLCDRRRASSCTRSPPGPTTTGASTTSSSCWDTCCSCSRSTSTGEGSEVA